MISLSNGELIMPKRISKANEINDALSPIVKLWVLRILAQPKARKDFMNKHGIEYDELATAIGLGYFVDSEKIRYQFFCEKS